MEYLFQNSENDKLFELYSKRRNNLKKDITKFLKKKENNLSFFVKNQRTYFNKNEKFNEIIIAIGEGKLRDDKVNNNYIMFC